MTTVVVLLMWVLAFSQASSDIAANFEKAKVRSSEVLTQEIVYIAPTQTKDQYSSVGDEPLFRQSSDYLKTQQQFLQPQP